VEDHLPLAQNLRARKLGAAAPIVVLDVIYHGGFAAHGGAQAGYGLPNDLRVLNDVGARTGTYSNLLRLRYDSTFRPVADTVLTDTLMAKGDAAAIKSLLQRYVVVTPTIRDVLARLGPAPPLQRPIYRSADQLSPPAL
jgi:hypothetical protein